MNKERKAAANKGFSLVELIIVIAIMAILGVVLAPQFTKYVEKSRVSTDKQNVAAIVEALQVYYIDTDIATTDQIVGHTDTTPCQVKLTTTTASVEATGVCTGNTDKALKAAGITSIGLKSSSWNTNGGTLTLTAKITNGVLSVTADDENIFK